MKDNNLLLRNARLVDGTGVDILERVSILVVEGVIADIRTGDITILSNDCRVIDLEGLTVLPGFINAHTHAGFIHVDGEPYRRFHEGYLEACLREGVTTVRDEGMLIDDPIESVVKNRNELASRGCFPRIVTTGKFISAPGGYGGKQPISVATPADVRTEVNAILDQGIDMIKTVLEDGFDPSTRGLPKLSDELLSTICSTAHARGTRVSAHVTEARNLERLVAAGIDDAGHMVYDSLSNELICKMVTKNVYVVPTLTLFRAIKDKFGAPFLDIAKKNVYRFVAAGGKVGLGDDFMGEEAPWYRLGMPRLELQLLQEAGLSNAQIIVAATKHGAEICGIANEVGTVEVGKNADLLVVDGNPLEDLNCLASVKYVIRDGRVVVKS